LHCFNPVYRHDPFNLLSSDRERHMERALRGIGMLGMLWLGTQAGMAQTGPAATPRPPAVAPLLQVAGAEVPVQLRQVSLDSRVVAGLGETRIEMEFFNPNARVLEGQLEFPLEDGQQIAGFALDIDGVLRDAVPVPKAKGRQVFEAIERRRVDPGLLEQTAGNQFRLRIYPIPARGSRRVALTFRETLPVDAQGLRWNLPLQFARDARQVTLRLDARGTGTPVADAAMPWTFQSRDGAHVAQWKGAGAALPAQVRMRLPQVRQRDVVTGLHEGERYLLAQMPVPAQATPRVLPKRVGLLWDASGSARQRDLAAETAVLDRYFRAIGDGEVELTVLRDRAETPRSFRIRGGDWSALRAYLAGLPLDGASALGAWMPRAGIGEYLLVSDGLSNYGRQALPTLAAGQRLYALSSAGARTDGARLRAWTQAHHGQALVLSSAAEVDAALPLLLQQPADVVELRGDGVDQLVADASRAGQGWLRVTGRVQRNDGVVDVAVRLADGRIDRQRTPQTRSPMRPPSIRCPGSSAWSAPIRRCWCWKPWTTTCVMGSAHRRRCVTSTTACMQRRCGKKSRNVGSGWMRSPCSSPSVSAGGIHAGPRTYPAPMRGCKSPHRCQSPQRRPCHRRRRWPHARLPAPVRRRRPQHRWHNSPRTTPSWTGWK
jgi:hypothetical protein